MKTNKDRSSIAEIRAESNTFISKCTCVSSPAIGSRMANEAVGAAMWSMSAFASQSHCLSVLVFLDFGLFPLTFPSICILRYEMKVQGLFVLN